MKYPIFTITFFSILFSLINAQYVVKTSVGSFRGIGSNNHVSWFEKI